MDELERAALDVQTDEAIEKIWQQLDDLVDDAAESYG